MPTRFERTKNLRDSIIPSFLKNLDIDFKILSRDKNLDMEFLRNNINENWDFMRLSSNLNLDMKLVHDYPDKRWNLEIYLKIKI